MKQNTLVIGASGTVGSELVKLLKAAGHSVKSATSKAAKDPGKVHINLGTGEGVKEAFEGVDQAFFLSPPGFADHYKILSPLIHEAKRRGLKKVVLMTALGANADANSPFRRAEVELEKSGLNYNIIRPNWFLQNFNTFWIHGILAQSSIALPAGNAKVSFIDARDISAVAARLLTSDDLNNQAFDITGPEAVDHNDVAHAISASAGKKITYQNIEPSVLKNGLVAAGLPVDYVDFLLLIFGFLREGYNAGVTDGVLKVTGKKPRSLQNYAVEYKQNWI
jgi:uncharacterized protein YbjT (DUF2867 family)